MRLHFSIFCKKLNSFSSKPAQVRAFNTEYVALGQALSDYGLVIALVILVSTIGLTNFSSIFQDLFGNKVSSPLAVTNTSMAVNTEATGTNGGVFRSNGNASPSSGKTTLTPAFNYQAPYSELPGTVMEIDLGSKGKFVFNNANPQSVAESNGGAGMTRNANSLIQQLVDQLEDRPGAIAPQTLQDLKDLSRKGYELANVQRSLQEQIPPESLINYQDHASSLYGLSVKLNNGASEKQMLELAKDLNPLFNYSDSQTLPKFDSMDLSMSVFDSGGMKGDPSIPSTTANFLAQVNRVRNSDFLRENPQLKAVVIDMAARQIYLSASATPYFLNPDALGKLVDTSETRSKDICNASKNNNCRPR
ncbi:MAG: hypothetical protein K2X66_04720 [Cyanobacteria bacterium]|nr:hypothetical protein [Cyanobacteriota bacterium]